jgi:hypothetical protein
LLVVVAVVVVVVAVTAIVGLAAVVTAVEAAVTAVVPLMAEGVMLLTTCSSAGVSTPTTVAIASIAAVATRRMAHPLPAGKPGTDILYRA